MAAFNSPYLGKPFLLRPATCRRKEGDPPNFFGLQRETSMPPSKSAAKREYDKPRLKQQIDRAMQAYLHAGNKVERVAPLIIPEPVALVRADGGLPQEALGSP